MSRKRKFTNSGQESDKIGGRVGGIVRPLDAADPRSLDHPSHREQWLEFARAIGRQIARDEREGRSGPHIGGDNDDG
jgi:hypothetical protein